MYLKIRRCTLPAFLAVLLLLFSCNEKTKPNSKLPRLKYTPPGTNHLVENIFIDQTEVTNMSWREYMYWIKQVYGAESPEYISTLPDTLVWKSCHNDFSVSSNQDYTGIESLVYLYMRHPEYSHYPVVGITFEQATQFCSWRSDRVNEVFYINDHKNVTFPIDSSIIIPKIVLFRLPSEKEWELAAKESLDSVGIDQINSSRIDYNTRESAELRSYNDRYERFIPMVEISLQPDQFNRYHLIGNVAEMTDKKGVAKGGSYIHTIKDSYYTKRIIYREPHYWLGFRCVCEILPYQKEKK